MVPPQLLAKDGSRSPAHQACHTAQGPGEGWRAKAGATPSLPCWPGLGLKHPKVSVWPVLGPGHHQGSSKGLPGTFILGTASQLGGVGAEVSHTGKREKQLWGVELFSAHL